MMKPILSNQYIRTFSLIISIIILSACSISNAENNKNEFNIDDRQEIKDVRFTIVEIEQHTKDLEKQYIVLNIHIENNRRNKIELNNDFNRVISTIRPYDMELVINHTHYEPIETDINKNNIDNIYPAQIKAHNEESGHIVFKIPKNIDISTFDVEIKTLANIFSKETAIIEITKKK